MPELVAEKPQEEVAEAAEKPEKAEKPEAPASKTVVGIIYPPPEVRSILPENYNLHRKRMNRK